MDETYELLDSGEGRKLERFGEFVLDRPSSQAVWERSLDDVSWKRADGIFTREGEMRWLKKVNREWECLISGIRFKISLTDFGHVGVFPEMAPFWNEMEMLLRNCGKDQVQVLNLFAYSGGASFACAKGGAHVCHLDASKGMIAWARENAELNGLVDAPIRWIPDDVMKFLQREDRRGRRYDAIILDPPSYGRGGKGEVFKIDEKVVELLRLCKKVLTPNPLFLLFTCHTPNFSPLAMKNLFNQTMSLPGVEVGELVIQGPIPLPSGTFARWKSV